MHTHEARHNGDNHPVELVRDSQRNSTRGTCTLPMNQSEASATFVGHHGIMNLINEISAPKTRVASVECRCRPRLLCHEYASPAQAYPVEQSDEHPYFLQINAATSEILGVHARRDRPEVDVASQVLRERRGMDDGTKSGRSFGTKQIGGERAFCCGPVRSHLFAATSRRYIDPVQYCAEMSGCLLR